jgi:ribosomal protein L32E
MPVERKKEIRRRRQRKRKLRKLKYRLAEAKDAKTREQLIEKIKRIQLGYIPPD